MLSAKALVIHAKGRTAAAARAPGQTTVARVVCAGTDGYAYFGSGFRMGATLFSAGHLGYPCGYSYSAAHDYTKFQYPPGLGLRSLAREAPYVGERVLMVGMPGSGRTVATSSGTVASLHRTVRVSWPMGAVVTEVDQMVVRGRSAEGMSGGAILAPDGNVVGMIDWGTRDGSLTGGSPASALR